MLSSMAVLASSTLILFCMTIDIFCYDAIPQKFNTSSPESSPNLIESEKSLIDQKQYRKNELSWRDAHLSTSFYLQDLGNLDRTSNDISKNDSTQTDMIFLTWPMVHISAYPLTKSEESKVQTTSDKSLQTISLVKNDIDTIASTLRMGASDELNLEVPNYIIQDQKEETSTSIPVDIIRDVPPLQKSVVTSDKDLIFEMPSQTSHNFLWGAPEKMQDDNDTSNADSSTLSSGSGVENTTNYNVLQYITEPISSTKFQRKPKDYQFIVSIWLRYEVPEYHAIGTLISLRHVLTAAHSISWKNEGDGTPVPFDNHMIGVRVSESNERNSSVEYDVVQTLIHYKWWKSKGKIRPNDVAILVLNDEVKLDLWSNLVQLVSATDVDLMMTMYSYTDCVSINWDRQQHQELSLIETQVKLIPIDECNSTFSINKAGDVNQSLELCVVAKGKGELCQADTERILFCEGKQVGILTSGGDCTDDDQPQIYTRIDVLTNWVFDQLHNLNKTLLRKVDDVDRSKSIIHLLSNILWTLTLMPFSIR